MTLLTLLGDTVSPGEILDIGASRANHFSVQIAPTDGSAVVTKTQADIAAGFSDPQHFYVDGNAVVFRPRADGATTTGSTFARDELREVNADGTNIAFNALSGEHIMSGRTTIMHTPANDPDVVIAQLHNGDADRISIRTQMFSNGNVVLGVRINGTLHATRFVDPWTAGTEFQWKIRMINGTAEIYYNNMTTPLITSTALVASTHPDAWYFKAGAYNQFNEVDAGATGLTVAASEYSEVRLRDLSVSHTAGGGGLTFTAGTSVESTASVTSTTVTLPAGLTDGDYTVIVVSLNSSTGGITTPAGWTNILASTASTLGSTSDHHAIFYRKWVSGDTNPAVTTASGRVAATPFKVAGADGTTFVDVAATVTQTADASTTQTAASITPASAWLVCTFNGRNGTSGNFQTPYTALSASMTKIAEASGKATAATNAGHCIAYEQVTANTATGTRQVNPAVAVNGGMTVSFSLKAAGGGAANVQAVPATATMTAPAPSVTVPADVQAVAATATMTAPAPTVGVSVTVQAVAATASATAPAPVVTVPATITAATGTATITAPAPTVTAAATITAVAATATVAAPAPVVAVGQPANVLAVPATATAAVPAPTVTVPADVAAPAATATITAPAPATSAAATVLAPAATATIAAPAPVVSTGPPPVTVAPPPATATVEIYAPVVGAGATVQAVTATASIAASAPAVGGSAAVTGLVATGIAAAPAPAVTAAATVLAVAATATAQAIAPQVTSHVTVNAPVATATATAKQGHTVTAGATVQAVAATATATANAPEKIGGGATVQAVRALGGTVQAHPPTVGGAAQVNAVVATATVRAHAPLVTGQAVAVVQAVTATATVTAHPPTAGGGGAVQAVRALAGTIAAPAPTVHAAATVQAVPATLTLRAWAPAVTGTGNLLDLALVAEALKVKFKVDPLTGARFLIDNAMSKYTVEQVDSRRFAVANLPAYRVERWD